MAIIAGSIAAAALVVWGIVAIVHKNRKAAEEGMVWVRFRLPKTTTAEQAANTRMPEDIQVLSGTQISDLSFPDRPDELFIGWFYDEGLTRIVAEGEKVDKETVLYPAFSPQENYAGRFSLNFVSDVDADENFAVGLVAYGLTEEEIREIVTVTSISRGGEKENYVLTKVSEAAEEQKTAETEISETLPELEVIANPEFGVTEKRTEIPWEDPDTRTNISGTRYLITGVDDCWAAGELHQVAIEDTDEVRFIKDDEVTSAEILYYNFSIAKEETNTLQMNSNVIFISAEEVSGVEVKGGLFEMTAGGENSGLRLREASGTLQYNGTLHAGDVVAVYDGILDETSGIVDGDVRYIKVTDGSATAGYHYIGADFTDVIAIPDEFPIADDGSYEDLQITVANNALDFSGKAYSDLGMNPDATIEPGEFLWFYRGDISAPANCMTVGYGRVVSISKGAETTTIIYEPVREKDIEAASEFYTRIDNLDVTFTEQEKKDIEEGVISDMMQSGFLEETEQYLMAILTDEEFDMESSKYAKELQDITFLTDTGENLSLTELRQIVAESKRVSMADKPGIKFAITDKLDNLEGKGVRIVVEVGFKIEIDMGGDDSTSNKLEIKVSCAFEQEIVLGVSVKVGGSLVKGYKINASFRAGTFTGFGACATIQTTSDSKNEDTDWDKLIGKTNSNLSGDDTKKLVDIGENLENLEKALNTYKNGGSYSKEKGEKKGKASAGEDDDGVQYAGTGGDLPEKYSAMMDNDAEYINIINQELFKAGVRVDPLQLIEVSIEGDFVVGFKLNAMLGLSVSYENEKEYSYSINVRTKRGTSKTADLKTPCFRSDAYAFGMIGIRAGILLDLRVGFLSTKLDSVGITAEAGIYLEVYGFVYASATWKSGEGFTASAQGSFLLEVGAYLEIKFLAQAGDGKWSLDKDIYSNQWPFWNLGDETFPLDFAKEQSEDIWTMEIKGDTASAMLPPSVFLMKLMDLKSGEISEESADSQELGAYAYQYAWGSKVVTQYKEKNFSVYLYDVDSDGKANGKHSFYYDVTDNRISVTPASNTESELWGVMVLTYKNKSFGFNTAEIRRSIKLHWKGEPATATVRCIDVDTGEVLGEETINGFNGVETVYMIDENLLTKYTGYIPSNIHTPDDEKMRKQYDTQRGIADSLLEKYRKSGTQKAKEEWKKADSLADALWERYNSYGWSNYNSVKAGNGPITFLMEKDKTVITLDFKALAFQTAFVCNLGTPVSFGRSYEGKYGDEISVKKLVPEAVSELVSQKPYHTFTWYIYSDTNEEPETDMQDTLKAALAHRDAWVEITSDAVLKQPDRNLVVLIQEDKPDCWMITFMAGGDVYEQYELAYGDAFIEPDQHKIPGAVVYGWRFAPAGDFLDGTLLYEKEKLNVRRDVVLEGSIESQPVSVIWNVNGNTFRSMQNCGDRLSEIRNEAKTAAENAKEGYTLNWYIETDEGRKKADAIPVRPNDTTITLYGVYTVNSYEVTWADENGTRKETLSYGTKLAFPKASENAAPFRFSVDGVEIGEGYTMPARNITVSVGRSTHEHVWVRNTSVASSCSKHGYDEYTCSVCGMKKHEDLPYDAGIHERFLLKDSSDATCGKDGYTGDTYCAECNALIRKGERIPATRAHSYGPETMENGTPTCTTRIRSTAVCKVCGDTKVSYSELDPNRHGRLIMSGEKKETCVEAGYSGDLICEDCKAVIEKGAAIPACGHQWETPAYTWSGDNRTVTATAVCKRDRTHTVSETVSTYTEPGKPADCKSQGYEYVCAAFTKEPFTGKVQSKQNVIPANPSAHVYGTPVYEWTNDCSSCNAKLVCLVCGNSVTENAKATKQTVEAPDCIYEGLEQYTAVFTNSRFTTQVEKKTTPALGHLYAEPVYTWSDDGRTCQAHAVCTRDSRHTVTESVAAKVEESSTAGYEKHTAAFRNELFATQSKEVPKAAEPVNSWDKAGSTATVIFLSDLDAQGDYYKGVPDPSTVPSVKYTYTVGQAGSTLPSDLFQVSGWVLDEWMIRTANGRSVYYTNASIVWTEPAENRENVIYLPALDEDNDMIVYLTAVHSKKHYNVTYYMNNGTDNVFEEALTGYVSEVTTGSQSELWELMSSSLDAEALRSAAGMQGRFLGWSTTKGGPVIQNYPDTETVGNKGTLKLYAVWGE